MLKGYYSKEPPKEGMGFIYTFSHPITHEIRYIGQTSRSLHARFMSHKNSAKNDKRAVMPIQRWIAGLFSIGLLPEMKIIAEVSLLEIDAIEIKYISEGRERYNLLNVAKGGKVEGRQKGWKPSDETIQRLIKSAKRGSSNSMFFDYVGIRIGRLTITSFLGFDEKNRSIWSAICDCGNNKIININQIQKITSCGCARSERWNDESKAAQKEKVNKKIVRSPKNGRFEKI